MPLRLTRLTVMTACPARPRALNWRYIDVMFLQLVALVCYPLVSN